MQNLKPVPIRVKGPVPLDISILEFYRKTSCSFRGSDWAPRKPGELQPSSPMPRAPRARAALTDAVLSSLRSGVTPASNLLLCRFTQ